MLKYFKYSIIGQCLQHSGRNAGFRVDGLKNIMVKTAVKTALILIAVLLIAFGVFNFACPQHMATFTENIGNYSLAVKYTSLRYSYTGDVYDLARCVEDCVRAESDANIVKYGKKLINHGKFGEVCEYKDERNGFEGGTYKQYICGKVASASYSLGDFESALGIAVEANGVTSFRYGNALMTLAMRVSDSSDVADKSAVLDALNAVEPSVQEEIELLNQVKDRVSADQSS